MMLTWLDPGFCNLFVHLFWGPELLTWDFTQKPRVGLHHDAVSSDSPSLKPVCQSAAARLLNWASSIYKSFLLSHFRVPAAKPASQKHPFTFFMPHPLPTLVSKENSEYEEQTSSSSKEFICVTTNMPSVIWSMKPASLLRKHPYRSPCSPCPGWPQGLCNIASPHRASSWSLCPLSWPVRSQGFSVCNQTWLLCYWALSPEGRNREECESEYVQGPQFLP